MRYLALAVLALAVGLAGCGGEESSSSGSPDEKTIEVSLSEFELDPAEISVDTPGTYTFHAVNDGQTVHALEVEGQGIEEETEDLQPGESADLTVELSEPGEYVLYCPVDDHKGKGMVGSVVVGGKAGGGTTTSEDEDDDGLDY